MCSAAEYFFYMMLGICCLVVSMTGYITGIALIYPIMLGAGGLLAFWLPFIIATIDA